MTAPALERRYALRKLAAGDWLTHSNDAATLWRFYQYEDGHHHGLDVAYELRTFWLAASATPDDLRAAWADAMDDPATDPAATIPSPWTPPWTIHATHLPTRSAAVNVMLNHPAPRPGPADTAE